MNPNTMNHIISATQHARNKHPKFADHICHALCLTPEERHELDKAIDVVSESGDTIAVLVRIAEKDFKRGPNEK